MKNYIKILPIIILVLFSSCMSVRKQVPYMVDAETIPTEVLSQTANMTDPVIGPGDLLNIEVTGTDMMAVSLFNKGKYLSADGTISQSSQGSSGLSGAYEKSTQYYLVDKDGNIEFPIVGKLNVGGLKKNQIIELIQSAIYPKYIKEVPAIDVRLMNFRVTVLGAVKGPGIIESKTERLNLLEAIASAGDLDIKGKRENIMLIRTNANGQREIHRLNLNDKEILLSPYFNLQQNDIIYVEPNKSATYGAWQLSPAVGATITIVGGISAIAGLNASLKWIQKIGIDNIYFKEQANRDKLISILKKFSNITVIDVKGSEAIGVLSCTFEGYCSDNIGQILSEQNVAVRTGLHCAPLAHKFIGTFPAGSVRFSVSYFNNDEDFEKLETALEYIQENS